MCLFFLVYGDPQANLYKKTGPRKREPRRHTLQNGIDYNMVCNFFSPKILFNKND